MRKRRPRTITDREQRAKPPSPALIRAGSLVSGGALGTAFAIFAQDSVLSPSAHRFLAIIAPVVGAVMSAVLQHTGDRLARWCDRTNWTKEKRWLVEELTEIIRRGPELLSTVRKQNTKLAHTSLGRVEQLRIAAMTAVYPERPWCSLLASPMVAYLTTQAASAPIDPSKDS